MRRVHLAFAVLAALAACNGSGPAEGPAAGSAAGSAEASVPAKPDLAGGSLRDALALGQRTGRNVLVEYSRATCPYCRQMKKGALSDSAVREALREVVYVAFEQGAGADSFEARWGKAVTPSFVALDPTGRQLGEMVSGVVSPRDFLGYVNWVATGSGPAPTIATGGG